MKENDNTNNTNTNTNANTNNSITNSNLTSTTNCNCSCNCNSKYKRIGVYDIISTIGVGNSSVCKLARNRTTNNKVAIKCIRKSKLNQNQLSRVYREIEIMKELDHPNIIKLIQVMESQSMLYLVTDYAANGELFGKKKTLKFKIIFLILILN
jgi:serine/threonine protein kinase